MGKSQKGAEIIHAALKEAGIDFVVYLPESWMYHLYDLILKDKELTSICVTREEEGFAVAAGAFLGGKKPAMILENTGFGNSGNFLSSVNLLCHIPVLILASFRTDMGDSAFFASGARCTEPWLEALGIPYVVLRDRAVARRMIIDAQVSAEAQKIPMALLLTKQLLWEEE